MSYRLPGPGLGFTPVTAAPDVTLDAGETIPTVHLGLQYEPEPAPLARVNVLGIPLWVALLGATYWLTNRIGGRI